MKEMFNFGQTVYKKNVLKIKSQLILNCYFSLMAFFTAKSYPVIKFMKIFFLEKVPSSIILSVYLLLVNALFIGSNIMQIFSKEN
jgi:hypothetical protein